MGMSITASAQNRLVSEQNLTDAILDRQTFLPVEMDSLDLNRDGTVDVADLTFYLLRTLNLVPSISFDTSTSKAFEGDENLSVRLFLTEPVDSPLTLTYTLSGTATYGTKGEGGDYTVSGYDPARGEGTIQLGPGVTEATILMTVYDDAIFSEGVETVTFSLTGGSSRTFFLGAKQTHTLFIDDNDAVWLAAMYFDEGGGYESFRLEIIQEDGTFDGRVIMDDTLIPMPEPGDSGASGADGWDARFYVATQALRIEIGPIPVDRKLSLFDAHRTRTYTLQIGPGLGSYKFNPRDEFIGLATETLEAVKSRLGSTDQRRAFLRREAIGELLLKRQPSHAVVEEVILIDEE